jgi:hypothetical protein
MKTCSVNECNTLLGNRNKHGYCQIHRNFSSIRKEQKRKYCANWFSKIDKTRKKILKERTISVKDLARSPEQLIKLNKIRKLSIEDRNIFFKNKKSKYNQKYESKRLKIDLNFKIAKNLRSRLSKTIKNNLKFGSAISDLGCSIEEFRQYIQSKFDSKMNWDNYGHKGWHLDHIRPLSSFDLTNLEQFKYACHYTNLQPLWAKDNLVKSNKYEEIL